MTAELPKTTAQVATLSWVGTLPTAKKSKARKKAAETVPSRVVPKELLLRAFACLSPQSLAVASTTCRGWHAITEEACNAVMRRALKSDTEISKTWANRTLELSSLKWASTCSLDPDARFLYWMIFRCSSMAADTFRRTKMAREGNLADFSKEKLSQLFERGIWYRTDYCEGLKRFKQNARLTSVISKGISYHGLASSKHFQKIPDPKSATGFQSCAFKMASHTTPSMAMDNSSLLLTACGEFRSLMASFALRDVIKPEKFDHLFAHDSPFSFMIHGYDENPIQRLFERVIIEKEEDLREGDRPYFSSIWHYTIKHPLGHGIGFNVIYSKGRYFGMGLPPEGLTKLEMEKDLCDMYNEDPFTAEFLSAEIWDKMCNHPGLKSLEGRRLYFADLAKFKMTEEEFQKKPCSLAEEKNLPCAGKLCLGIDRLVPGRVVKLMNATLQTIREVFATFPKSMQYRAKT